LNDRDFLQQMVPRLERLPQPFCAWLITLSLHHPFEDFPDRHKVLKLGRLEGTSFGNYLHTMRFFDRALDEFTAALKRVGLLENTMLVVFGDHDAGFSHDAETARLIGTENSEVAWTTVDRVPFFVRIPNIVVDFMPDALAFPAGQTDFAPTLLALLGIDPSVLPYVGRNLLGTLENPPVLRPYGDWIDRAHLFLATGPNRSPACFARPALQLVDPTDCRPADERARRARDVSRLVVVHDLQQHLADTFPPYGTR
jgi:phosphoglycerol transferase MdoB-like AlkP superfamily enzyme